LIKYNESWINFFLLVLLRFSNKLLQVRIEEEKFMQTQNRIKLVGYVSTILTFICGFAILSSKTGDFISSFLFAVLAALMIWGTFIIIGWLASVLIK